MEPATLRFVLTDAESDSVETTLLFRSIPGGATEPITALDDLSGAPARNPILLATSPTGVLHEFRWSFNQEGSITDVLTPGIELLARIGSSGTPVPSLLLGVNGAIVDLGNEAPEILSIAEVVPPGSEVSGVVPVQFTVADSSSDIVRVRVEFLDTVDTGAGWQPATPSPLTARPPFAFEDVLTEPAAQGGAAFTFFWNTIGDLGTTDRSVRLRFTPEDAVASGVAAETPTFAVDNNEKPIVQLDSGPVISNLDERRGIPIPFRVLDDEGDLVDVVFQWRRPNEQFPELPGSETSLDAILVDPVLRREHHICSPYPHFARGRAIPVDATSVRLPELASSESWITVSGVEGRRLELLRPSILVPIASTWPANPLLSPVAALPIGDGLTALVLDVAGLGWRIREIELATGNVVRDIAAVGPGTPTAMDLEREGKAVLVASDLGGTWRLDRVELATGSVSELFTSNSSIEPPPVRGLASFGTKVVLLTAGSSLLHLDYRDPLAPRISAIRNDLATPWGLQVDPLTTNRVYLAERDAVTSTGTGRFLALRLDTHEKTPVVVKPGTQAIEQPEGLALARNGARLLVVARGPGGSRQLVGLDLAGRGGSAPFPLGPPIVGAVSSVTSGPDELVLLTVRTTNELIVGGGLEQRRAITAYESQAQTAHVDAAMVPSPRQGQRWRIPMLPVRATPNGIATSFVWNSEDVGGGPVLLRALARDKESGLLAQSASAKNVRSSLAVTPNTLGGSQDTENPNSVAAADLDRDGDLDLVTTTNSPDGIVIFFQAAPGKFGPNHLFLSVPGGAFGSDPRSVAAADIDRDGDNDIVSANRGSNNLTIFFQTTPGSFGTSVPVGSSATLGPDSVVVADLNGDGNPDLVSSNVGTFNLTIFFQTAVGGFVAAPPLPVPGGGFNRKSVAAADLDGDGDLDLVSANSSDNLSVFFQTSPGNFGPNPLSLPVPLGTFGGGNAQSVVAADLDGNGALDLVSANVGGENLSVFFQSNPGSFDTPVALRIPEDGLPRSVAAADLDADGDLDLVSATQGNDLTVFFQISPGEFDPTPAELDAFAGFGPIFVATADLDGNGYVDLAAADFFGDQLTVMLQTAPGSFDSQPLVLSGPIDAQSVALTDLDGDGDIDCASANVGSDQAGDGLAVFFQTDPGAFDPVPVVLGGLPITGPSVSIDAADLDGDGDNDIVSANQSSLPFAGDTVTVFFQTDFGYFELTPLVLPGSSGSLSTCIAAADLDGDGDNDIVSANSGNDDLKLFSQGAGGFGAPISLSSPVAIDPKFVAAADMDGDGDLDLVSANPGSDNLTIFFRAPTGIFGPPLPLGAGSIIDPQSVAVGDFDSDGDLDLASGNTGTDDLTIFPRTAAGIFGPPIRLGGSSVTSNPESVAAGDVDGDGDTDLVSANFNNSTVFLQIEPGRFDPNPLLIPLTNARFLGVSDVDGDGDFDLVGAIGSGLEVFWGGR